jgi:ribose transport system substrate-binding protein
MYHDASYYVTNQRDQAVKNVLEKNYPNIKIIANKGIANPNDGEAIASAIITQNPQVNAIYAPWDGIAEGVIAATKSANRKDIKVYTMDLGETNVLDMAKKRNMSGIIADLPYELGGTLAKIGALSAIGIQTPAFVTVPAIKISRDNLKSGWVKSLKRPLPKVVQKALSK